jgi:hypothetical protein
MILAKNKMYSLHELEPDTYCHKTYVLVEMLGSTEAEHRVTLFTVRSDRKDQLEKLVRSIKNGADGANIELHPLHFVCGFVDLGVCPANERATALRELREEKEQNLASV